MERDFDIFIWSEDNKTKSLTGPIPVLQFLFQIHAQTEIIFILVKTTKQNAF